MVFCGIWCVVLLCDAAFYILCVRRFAFVEANYENVRVMSVQLICKCTFLI